MRQGKQATNDGTATHYSSVSIVVRNKPHVQEQMLALIFAAGVVLGQVGQNVSLPLWVDASTPSLDPYFILLFASLSFVVIFSIGTVIQYLRGRLRQSDLKLSHHLNFALIGFLDALNGVMVVFASPGTRTAPFLQSVLGNFVVPMTVLFRFILLRKLPSRTQTIAACGVVCALFLALVPSIFKMDGATNAPPPPKGSARVLWPMCFMLGFAPSALMNVLEEKVLKADGGDATEEGENDNANKNKNTDIDDFGMRMDSRSTPLLDQDGAQEKKNPLDIINFLLWSSVYQFLTLLIVGAIADIIPSFGTADSFHQLVHNVKYGMNEFFLDFSTSGFRGFIFVSCYTIAYLATAGLLRHSEGATWLAVVTALVTPIGGVWWTLFRESPFGWDPQVTHSTYFSLAGLALMCPCILLYKRSSGHA